MQFFQDLMPSLNLSRWTPAVLRKHLLKEETESIESLCRMMMKSDGEYSSLFLAERILNAFAKLDYRQHLDFFSVLLVDYDIDTDNIKSAVEEYDKNSDAANLLRVTLAAEPGRQELLRRINLAPGEDARTPVGGDS